MLDPWAAERCANRHTVHSYIFIIIARTTKTPYQRKLSPKNMLDSPLTLLGNGFRFQSQDPFQNVIFIPHTSQQPRVLATIRCPQNRFEYEQLFILKGRVVIGVSA